MTYFLISFLVSMAFTFVGMPLLLHLCKVRGLYDMPNDRKLHSNKIPRLGGVFFAPAMLLGLMAALAYMLWNNGSLPTFGGPTLFVSIGLFLIYLIGLIDDILGLNARIKFAVQFVSALLMPLCGLCLNNLYGLFGIYELPLYVGYPLTVFVSLLIINSVNLIDGIDGLAGSLSLISLGALALFFYDIQVVTYTIMAGGLMGSVLAFLYYNIWGRVERNTKTFMGDTGSLILGYALAFLCIKHAMHNPGQLPYRPDALMISYTLVLVPVFDLIRVAICRLLQGKSIFHADKTHIHHKLMAAGLTMHQALIAIIALSLFFIGINMAGLRMDMAAQWIILLDIAIYWGILATLKVCESIYSNSFGKQTEP